MKKETIEEYLKRGGKITQLQNGLSTVRTLSKHEDRKRQSFARNYKAKRPE